jgi:hypothetical protein
VLEVDARRAPLVQQGVAVVVGLAEVRDVAGDQQRDDRVGVVDGRGAELHGSGAR